MAFTDSEKWLVLVSVAFTGYVLYLLAPVLTPFFVAALLAYLGDPIVDRMEARGRARTTGVVVVFAVMFLAGVLALVVLLPLVQTQIRALVGNIPAFLHWIQDYALPYLSGMTGLSAEFDLDIAAVRQAIAGHWNEVGSVAGFLMTHIGRSGQILLGWLTYFVLVPVVTFYLLRDWDILIANIHDLLPRHIEAKATEIAKECDAVLAEFLRGQLTLMLVQAVIYVTGLWLIGLELALAVGVLAGLVSFVPYLGIIVGLVVAGGAAVVQFHDVIHLVGVAAVFGVGQLLEGMVLSPLLVGDRIGLHPVAVIFAVMAGGQLFGFMGVLLALPVAAMIVVFLRHTKQHYQNSSLYGP